MPPTLRTRAPKAVPTTAAAATTIKTTVKDKARAEPAPRPKTTTRPTRTAVGTVTKASAASTSSTATATKATKAQSTSTKTSTKTASTTKGKATKGDTKAKPSTVAAAKKKVSSSTAVVGKGQKAAPRAAAAMKNAKSTKAAKVAKGKTKGRSKAVSDSDDDNAGAVLDYSAYPHIVEAIIEAAPYASLLRLRGVCKALRAQADAMLGHHVVLRSGLPPPRGKKWERANLPKGPPKARARTYRVNAASFDGQLPGWVCDYNHVTNHASDSCGSDCDRYRSYWEAVFAHDTKIVDWQPWGDQGQLMQRAVKAFTNLEVVRCFPFETRRLEFKAPKVVIFTHFNAPDPKSYERVGYSPTMYLDGGPARHLVTTVHYDCARPSLPSCWVTLPSLAKRQLENITLIFLPADDSEDAANPAWATADVGPGGHRQNGLLWEVANFLRVDAKLPFTIVGATEMPRELIGVHDDIERGREELQDLVMDNIVAWIKDDHDITDEREDEIRGQVKWMTRDEYREHVGPEQWKIDTEPSYNWNE